MREFPELRAAVEGAAGPAGAVTRTRSAALTGAERALCAGQLTIRSARRGSAHCIVLSGELDVGTADGVEHELRSVEATDADEILLDLSGLDFIDSAGLRLIILASDRSQADRDRLRLLRGPSHVQRIFELTATTDRLPFAD